MSRYTVSTLKEGIKLFQTKEAADNFIETYKDSVVKSYNPNIIKLPEGGFTIKCVYFTHYMTYNTEEDARSAALFRVYDWLSNLSSKIDSPDPSSYHGQGNPFSRYSD